MVWGQKFFGRMFLVKVAPGVFVWTLTWVVCEFSVGRFFGVLFSRVFLPLGVKVVLVFFW